MVLLYSSAIFLSAFLLFLVQPMISKMLLPYLGGSPAVWNTSMMVFQLLLLLGYSYTHLTSKYFSLKKQTTLHLLLCAAAIIYLPVALRTNLPFSGIEYPIGYVVLTLLLSVGLPFLVLAANAPLVQHWFAKLGHKDSGNPYFLYAASNAGSLLALAAYPLVMETQFTLQYQSYIWSALFMVFIGVLMFCARQARKLEKPLTIAQETEAGLCPTFKQRLRWVALAFIPSSLMLGVTTYITTDIASLPLLWVIPLALYLLSFIFAFSNPPKFVEFALKAQIALLPIVAIIMTLQPQKMMTLLIFLHLAAFFATATACHGLLSRGKPHPRYLTEFFLWISAGGALGGIFNSLIAPLFLMFPAEYFIVFAFCVLARPMPQQETLRARILDYVIPVIFAAILSGLAYLYFRFPPADAMDNAIRLWGYAIISLMAIGFCWSARNRPDRFLFTLFFMAVVLKIASIPLEAGAPKPAAAEKTATKAEDKISKEILYSARNFFGVVRIIEDVANQKRTYVHGNTVHGLQSIKPGEELKPTAYYGKPLRQIFSALPRTVANKPIAAVGLGAGTVACYGRKGQTIDFYEINPMVAYIATTPTYFTYLKNCPPTYNIILGDGRLEIAKQPDLKYGIIIMDAFSSDAIPIHLLTREALASYKRVLAEDGIIAFNISNRHMNLEQVMVHLADDAGLSVIIKPKEQPENSLETPSVWVAMTRDKDIFRKANMAAKGWESPTLDPKTPLWTDQYSNIIQLLF